MRLEGGDELRRALREFPAAVEKGAKRGMKTGVIRVQRSAREKAPVDTGRLRASIAYAVESMAGGVKGIVGSAVHYAPIQEFGTAEIRAQPYLRPAAEENLDRMMGDIKREINRMGG